MPKHHITACYLLFVILFSFCFPFYAKISNASNDYYDIIEREKNIELEETEQIGTEYRIIYENLFIDILVVKNVGPLQGFFQIGITYDNSETDGQTSLIMNLQRLNFFLDNNGDQCQSWIASQIIADFGLEDIDNLICSIIPMSNIGWIKKNFEFNRTSGVDDIRFIPFFKTQNKTDTFLNWGIQQKLIYALSYENKTYWNYNITMDFCISFRFFVRNKVAYLEHYIRLENCSIHQWIPILLEFSSINLALEWKSEVSVTKGFVESPVLWSLNNLIYECVTVAGVSSGKIINDNVDLGTLKLGTSYLVNNQTSYQLRTSAIPLQKRSKTEGNVTSTKLLYAQTIVNYQEENITLGSKFEFYISSNTLNIVFIVLFNVLISVIIVLKGLDLKRRGVR